MLTRKQIEALCLGCNECEGVRERCGTLYIILENEVKFISYLKTTSGIKLSKEVDMLMFKQLQKIHNIDELRDYLTEYYPSMK